MEPENTGKSYSKYWVSSMANSLNISERSNTDGTSDGQSALKSICSYEERFRVDRRKLEQLIVGAHDCADSAEEFFNSIMEETNTVIAWPYRLKMGAKSRKDPYVRISGIASDVKKAKEKVKNMLDTRESRAILKLDISYTDHSHIIGKGGQTIQRVMEVTGCHIHFPDSNRNNAYDKSNQVSVSGKIEGVERARHQLRMLTPLVFSFQLPMKNPLNAPLDQTSPLIWMVQERYNVHVNFLKGSKLFSYTVLVKGSELELTKVEEATAVLIRHLCDAPESEVLVQMTMEITPNHHLIVRGYGNYNLKMIMQQTSTSIIFPDSADPNLPPLKKSTVTICGCIHNVYLARQRLVGSLPLMLMFDMEEEYNVAPELLNEIMNQHDVEISIRLKPKYRVYSVCIKGVERNAGNMYEARKKILNSNEPTLIPDIPATYFPMDHPGGVDQRFMIGGILPSALLPVPSLAPAASPVSTGSTLGSDNYPQTSVVASYHGSELIPEDSSLSHQNENAEMKYTENLPVGNQYYSSFMNQSYLGDKPDKEELSGVSSDVNSLPSPTRITENSSRSARLSTHGIDSGYGDTCDFESARANGSPVAESDHEMDKVKHDPFQTINSDYQSIKHLAMKDMQVHPDASKCRIPNMKWSGFGFSHSMPESALKINIPLAQMDASSLVESSKDPFLLPLEEKLDNLHVPEYSPSMSMDLVVSSRRLKENATDINSLLEVISLEKYAYIFTSQEIDMTTFLTLNDSDLRELGITTFGARRKIIMAISELKKSKNHFIGDAAPGAERKSTSSSCWSDNPL